MDRIFYIISIFLLSPILVACTDKYDILPPLFEMENYTYCMERDGLYCKADALLMGKNLENGTLWKLIQESVNTTGTYNRDVIHRAICIPKNKNTSSDTIRKFTQTYINEKLKFTGLTTYANNIICASKNIEISTYDIIFMTILVIYVLFVLYVTYYHMRNANKIGKAVTNKTIKIIACFSILSHWEKLCKVEANDDLNKLKSIQGIRTYNMLLIMLLHTMISYYMVFIANPVDVEKLMNNAVMVYFTVLSVFFTKTFFLISSWILTVKIYNIYKAYGSFTLKHMCILIIDRYFRLTVCLAVVVLWLKSCWPMLIDSPVSFEITKTIHMACKRNWWLTLLQLNNYLYLENTCNISSWQLSVDVHLYVLATITIYIILKYKLNEWKVLGFLFVVSCVLYGSIIYIYDMNIILKTDVNFTRRHVLFRHLPAILLYTSTHSNWGTSIVGICLGILYSKNKYRKINCNNKGLVTLWLLMFFGLPCLVIFIAKNEFRGFAAAILGPLMKPLFTLGIGIGILGMSHNIGGIIKRVCEHKTAVWISNFSFSIYVFELLVIFNKGIGLYSPIKIDISNMLLTFFFIDAPITIAVGIVATLIFEKPGLYLQKMFLPQLYEKKVKSEKRQ